VVVDVGGTTTDVGILVKGFPRESSVAVEMGGVRTNFRMPDLIVIGLGGGSLVRRENGSVSVGPQSVGYKIVQEALIFGGKTLTATDITVAIGRAKLGDSEKVRTVSGRTLKLADEKIKEMVEEAIDRIKTSPKPVPVILVGGGSILLPETLKGASQVVRPDHFEVANAFGAAIAQVGGEIDRVFSLEKQGRDKVLAKAKEMAKEKAINSGADPNTVEIVDIEEIPLAYLPGNAVRIRVKAAGVLSL
jgi:N-methylhydantoinase A/oxoprolinase/acetone carboxylase beta subunit